APTTRHISSSSAVRRIEMRTVPARGRGGSNVGLTCCSTVAFFYYGDHGRRANLQHASSIANATPIDGHVNHLATDLGCSAAILVLQEKDSPRALFVLTLIALGAVGLRARL